MQQNEVLNLILERVSGIEGKVSGIEGKVSGIEGKVSGIEGKVSGIEEELIRVKCKVEQLNEKQDATIRRVVNLESNLRETDSNVKSLMILSNNMNDKLAKTEIQVGVLARNYVEMNDRLGKAENEIGSILLRSNETLEKVNDIKTKQDMEYRRISGVVADVDELKDLVKNEERFNKNNEEIPSIKKIVKKKIKLA